VLNDVKNILALVLQTPTTIAQLQMDSPLLGALPELDSMAVVSILTALEEQYGFVVEDDEIDASVFETLGALVNFVQQKSGAWS
jgi:acyl carrier protein